MKRHRQGLLLTLAMGTLLVIAMIATGCNGKVYSVYGRVTIRGTGVGIEDARIACGVHCPTDSSGYWGVSDLSGPTTVSVTKEGWKFEPESIQAYGGRADVDFQGHELDYRGLLSDSSQWAFHDVKNTATGEPDETGWIIQRWQRSNRRVSKPCSTCTTRQEAIRLKAFIEVSRRGSRKPRPLEGR